MEQQKLDSRIKILIENCVKKRHRCFFVLVGSKGRDMIPNLHYLLSRLRKKASPNILWCYKKNLGFRGDDASRKKELIRKAGREKALEDPFHVFLSVTNIRYCYFKDTQKILGSTYEMLVIQEFEGITPNVMARTMETVEGGGMIVLLLPEMSSLRNIYSMPMDFHNRFKREFEPNRRIINRFNERFLLSLANCKTCLVCTDRLKILPISSHIKTIQRLPQALDLEESDPSLKIIQRLRGESEEMEKRLLGLENSVLMNFVKLCRTYDQAKVLLSFMDTLNNTQNSLQSTVALTSARGRGKSACLGLVISIAIHLGYSNIFVTAPSPENLQTLFQFVVRGLDALSYKDREDYEIMQAVHPQLRHSIVRINVRKRHRQTIQYIRPSDYSKLGQAEILVIDEAAAIPLPMVRSLLGPYLIFISSTVNGYEGTGRSLSLKLFQELKKRTPPRRRTQNNNTILTRPKGPPSQIGRAGRGQQRKGQPPPQQRGQKTSSLFHQKRSSSRRFQELELTEPIRYGPNDEVERWLHEVLCLDATLSPPEATTCPHPSECDLYFVNKETLFSYHKETEIFLHQVISLFTSSHYRNSPNDLQLLSDSPDHHIFVLLGPIDAHPSGLPDIFAALQVCEEGAIRKDFTQSYLSQGRTGHGDMVPWVVSRYFQETGFGEFKGLRIVRIATHPSFQRMGYGTRSMRLLTQFYEGKLKVMNLMNDDNDDNNNNNIIEEDEDEDEDDDEEEEENEEKSKKKKHVHNHKQQQQQQNQEENVIIPPPPPSSSSSSSLINNNSNIETEIIKQKEKSTLPPLLESLDDRDPKSMDYLSVSYGLTEKLFNFWSCKLGFKSVYVRMSANEMTGEHTCMMLKDLYKINENQNQQEQQEQSSSISLKFHLDFRKRFMSLLSFREFRKAFTTSLVLGVLGFRNEEIFMVKRKSKTTTTTTNSNSYLSLSELMMNFSKFDMKRLNVYCKNLVDYRIILDQIPVISKLYFMGKIPVRINTLDEAILVGIGFQRKSFRELSDELLKSSNNNNNNNNVHQIVSLFNQTMKKIVKFFNLVYQKKFEEEEDEEDEDDESVGTALKRKRNDDDDDIVQEKKKEKEENENDNNIQPDLKKRKI